MLPRFRRVFDNLVDLSINKEGGSSSSSDPRALKCVIL
jgi:hypothetical protein